MPLTYVAWSATSTGAVRAVNEDSVLVSRSLFAVADGMGGHAAGDIASRLAVDRLAPLGRAERVEVGALLTVLEGANHDITRSAAARGLSGMGTTVTGAAVVEVGGRPHWLIFNIGDSRVYDVKDDRLIQVTVDHSEVQELVDTGQITRQEARSHPLRHVVTRALGSPAPPVPDTWLLPMSPAQTLVLCSDGLTADLTDDDIAAVVSAAAPTLATCADDLVSAAERAGGSDNISVIVLHTSSARTGKDDTRPHPRVVEPSP